LYLARQAPAWAARHLPTPDTPTPPDEKPKLRQLRRTPSAYLLGVLFYSCNTSYKGAPGSALPWLRQVNAHPLPCSQQRLGTSWRGGWVMTYDTDDSVIEFALARLRSERPRRARQDLSPAIKMTIGDWYVDDNGVRTREISASE